MLKNYLVYFWALNISYFIQAARQLEFFKGRSSGRPNTDSLGDALAIAQHHDAVTGTEKQHVANDYAKRLSIGYTQVIICSKFCFHVVDHILLLKLI